MGDLPRRKLDVPQILVSSGRLWRRVTSRTAGARRRLLTRTRCRRTCDMPHATARLTPARPAPFQPQPSADKSAGDVSHQLMGLTLAEHGQGDAQLAAQQQYLLTYRTAGGQPAPQPAPPPAAAGQPQQPMFCLPGPTVPLRYMYHHLVSPDQPQPQTGTGRIRAPPAGRGTPGRRGDGGQVGVEMRNSERTGGQEGWREMGSRGLGKERGQRRRSSGEKAEE